MQESRARSNEALVRQLSAWLDGIDYEIKFWNNWMETKGGQWADDFVKRENPDNPVDPALFEGMDTSETQKVLDVGAGPASFFGYRLDGRPIELSACDPLAPQYAEMAARNGVSWPVPTMSGFAEDLSAFYPCNSFDMVVCRNALDHSFDPVRGIEEMLLVLKTGGRINLRHYVNEAEEGNYVGFHQWNFDVVDGRPVIWNPGGRIDLIERFGNYADIRFEKKEKERWVSFRFDKKCDPVLAEDRARMRIAELLLATRDAFLSRPAKPVKREERRNRHFVISAANPRGVISGAE
jgi:SAM-dependent methyltransferase